LYSFGIGEDVSFDLSLIRQFGLQVFAFDPTPKAVAYVRNQSLPRNVHFHEYGISDYDGTAHFYPPENPDHASYSTVPRTSYAKIPVEAQVYRLQTIAGFLEHTRIDILKLDIEGGEFGVIKDIVATSRLHISQILVEYHPKLYKDGYLKVNESISILRAHAYKIFAISSNGNDFGFLKT
jgi:FkbM family methyltransferase